MIFPLSRCVVSWDDGCGVQSVSYEVASLVNKKLEVDIPIAWEYVRVVRQRLEAALSDISEELRSAAVMVASELVENAIKYGVAVPALPQARFRFEVSSECLTIEVANGVATEKVFDAVRAIVAELQEPGASERLYLDRLQQLVDNPLPPNRLGLYRIGFEGKFSLRCSYENQSLVLTAQRNLS
jgi:hypothetical protein